MEELINFIIEIAHSFKYGQWVNRKRQFGKELEDAKRLDGEQALYFKKIANDQLSALIEKGNGIPSYAYFKAKGKGWYRIYILNNEKGFYCRLRDTLIQDFSTYSNFYITIK